MHSFLFKDEAYALVAVLLKVVVRDALFARTFICVVSLRILSGTGWKGVDWQRLTQGACCLYLSEYFKEKKLRERSG